jgi:hypothetical protein
MNLKRPRDLSIETSVVRGSMTLFWGHLNGGNRKGMDELIKMKKKQ